MSCDTRAALVSVATLYRMIADATIRINRSLFKFTYWLQCGEDVSSAAVDEWTGRVM